MHLKYFWVNKSYLLALKNKMVRVMKKFFVCVLKRNYSVMKTLRNYFRGKQQSRWKLPFILKRNDTVMETLCYLFIFFINYLVIKIFHIVSLTALGIHLYVVSPVLLFVQLFDTCVISRSRWMAFSYLYLC